MLERFIRCREDHRCFSFVSIRDPHFGSIDDVTAVDFGGGGRRCSSVGTVAGFGQTETSDFAGRPVRNPLCFLRVVTPVDDRRDVERVVRARNGISKWKRKFAALFKFSQRIKTTIGAEICIHLMMTPAEAQPREISSHETA